jgi:hypothetical protein
MILSSAHTSTHVEGEEGVTRDGLKITSKENESEKGIKIGAPAKQLQPLYLVLL